MLKNFFILFIILSLFSGCKNKTPEKKSFTISCTTFPVYEATREICKGLEEIEIKIIISGNDNFHNFIPAKENILTILNSDLFIFSGYSYENWLNENFLSYVKDYINLEENGLEIIRQKNSDKPDEHWWFSFKNFAISAGIIKEKLSKIFPEQKEKFLSNLQNLQKELEILDTEYTDFIKNIKVPLIFGGKFPFQYLFRNSQNKYFSLFDDCTFENQYTFKKIITLAGEINKNNINEIFISNSEDKFFTNLILQKVRTKKCRIIELNSMHTAENEVNNYSSYIETCKNNLKLLQLHSQQ